MLLLPISRKDLLKFLPQGGVAAEIGVQQGRFTRHILRNAKPGRLHLIDPWQPEESQSATQDPTNRFHLDQDRNYERVARRFRRRIRRGEVFVHRSSSPEVAAEFQDEYFDWVYLDANHSYDSVFNDLLAFDPKVKQDGFIMGHDYTNQPIAREWNFGVVPAVNEFVTRQNHHFLALTMENFPTYVISKSADSDAATCLTDAIIEATDGVVEIKHYVGGEFIHKAFEFGGASRGKSVRRVMSF